jgi:hypothetical protein
MVDHPQGHPGADRAVGRPGPVGRMAPPQTGVRPSVLIPPVGGASAGARGANSPAPSISQGGGSAPPATSQRNVAGGVQGQSERRTAIQRPPGPRAARVYLTRVDPWSVLKQSFLLSVAVGVVLLVGAAALWYALDSAGVIDAVTRTATDVAGEGGSSIGNLLQLGRVMGIGLVLAGVEIVLMTALATLFAFIYNLSVGLGGGLEVTLSEDDH